MKFSRFEFKLLFLDDFKIPDFLGSVLRSSFGKFFKDISCRKENQICFDCNFIKICPYSYVFETNIRDGVKVFNAPHPFVFELPKIEKNFIKKNKELTVQLKLFGEGIKYFPYFIETFITLGKIGIGSNRARFKLNEVSKNSQIIFDGKNLQDNWDTEDKIVFSPDLFLNGTITLEFVSPTKIIFQGELIKVPSFESIIHSIIRRLKLLDRYHNIGVAEDFENLIGLAKNIQISNYYLYEVNKRRYSFRKNMEMEFKAFEGEITYNGNFQPFNRILKYGEIVHIGKATAFGFGQFKIKGG